MKKWIGMVVAVAMLAAPAISQAAELKSGIQKGKHINAFDVVKCAGSEDDGVKIGSELCYRCKYGSRPMVMVFARTSDEKLASFVKELDKAVKEHSDDELKAFVNLIGDNRDSLETDAKEFGKKNEVENVPIVVPVEYENGPEDYGISPDADVTVMLAVDGKVSANFALAKDKLDDEAIKEILKEVPDLVK